MKTKGRTRMGALAVLGLAILGTGAFLPAGTSFAAGELNLYSARHYSTDEALYENFTKQTGIKINRIEGKGDALLARIKSEGVNSPADVLLTVDVGRLYRADQAGLWVRKTKGRLRPKRRPKSLALRP